MTKMVGTAVLSSFDLEVRGLSYLVFVVVVAPVVVEFVYDIAVAVAADKQRVELHIPPPHTPYPRNRA